MSLEKDMGRLLTLRTRCCQMEKPVRKQLQADPFEYDLWFDYARLEESHAKDNLRH